MPTSAGTQSPSMGDSTILLRDDFTGAALDMSKWSVPVGEGSFLGRTQIRPPSESLSIAGGLLRLRLDSYNPTARRPGDSFWGSEIVTQRTFERGAGLAFRARARLVSPVVPGLVASLFSYTTRTGVRDEIDFEILTNDVMSGRSRILTNLFDNDPFSVPGLPAFVPFPQATDFNDLEVQWTRDGVRWLVNGAVVREESLRVPDEPMSVRLNFWAPGSDFADAFDTSLQPATSAAENRSYFYEIDFVEVRRHQAARN